MQERHQLPLKPGRTVGLSGLVLLAMVMITGAGCRTMNAARGPERLKIEKRGPVRLISLKELPAAKEREKRLPYLSGAPLHTGLDTLVESNFAPLRGRSFALLTNATSRDNSLNQGLDIMLKAGVRPALLLEPEHGLFGHQDWEAKDGIRVDPVRGLRILSLFSRKLKRPEPRHLRGLDLIVVDIQNLPVRCYTYVSTLTYLMESAHQAGIEIMILDRPNPYGHWQAAGPMLNKKFTSFVSAAPVPYLYSLTLGEYALYLAARKYPRLKVSVLPVMGYRRGDIDATLRRAWINPSPNIPDLESALVYAGVVFYEGANVSLGRGTTRPFVYSGAPWMKADEVLARMRKLKLPGVRLGTVRFTPWASKYKGKSCDGIQIIPVSAEFDAVRVGYEYMRIVRQLHPNQFKFRVYRGSYFLDYLWGGDDYRKALIKNLSYDEFRRGWLEQARAFENQVKDFRLY